MKKTILLGITAAGAVMLLASCSDDWGMKGEGRGSIAPLVGVDTQVITSQKSSDSQTAAASRADEDAVTAADLSIRLTKSDGSWSNTWEKLTDFDATQQFAVGDYLIEAFYGDENEEGFEKPSYEGSQMVAVADQRTTEVALTAGLSKCMISIDYTDTFKNYMSSWSASVKGAGPAIEYTADETRPLYLVPGEASITINVVKPNGLSGTFDLAKVSTKARYSYHVTVDVNEGNAGDATLTVSFDENLAHEDVLIDISDEIMNMPPPTVDAVGFEAGVPVTVLSGIDSDLENLSMNILALGGLKEINLTTKSEYLLSQGWPETVELIGATPEMQSRLTELGLQTLGIWKNPAEMGVLEFIGVANKIKTIAGDNSSTFTITVTDKQSHVSQPFTLEVQAESVTLNTALKDELYSPGQDSQIQVAFSGNLNTLKKALRLQFVHNDSGIWRDITVKDIVEASATDAARTETTPQLLYDVTFVAPAEMNSELNVRAIAGDVVTSAITLQPLIVTVDANDIFAKSATASVSTTATLFIRAKGDTDFSEVATATGSHRITGLVSATEYEIKAKSANTETAPISFTTESEAQLPYGNMDEGWSSSKKSYGAYSADYWTAPSPWATNNDQTTGSANGLARNTAISAVLKSDDGHEGNAALIRTVGYGLKSAISYSAKSFARGVMSLNTNLTSRPSGLSFYAKYTPYESSEYGILNVIVKDGSGNVITSGTENITSASEYGIHTINLDNYASGCSKASSVEIYIYSTNIESPNTTYCSNPQLNKGQAIGSQLYIDDITLTY